MNTSVCGFRGSQWGMDFICICYKSLHWFRTSGANQKYYEIDDTKKIKRITRLAIIERRNEKKDRRHWEILNYGRQRYRELTNKLK